MEIIDRTEKRSSIVDLVNPIVERAFGRGFKGNYDYAYDSITDGPEGLKEVNRLCMIGRKRFLSYRIAGQLGDNHSVHFGSVIAVYPRYESAAKIYANLYKEKTEEDVKIILTDRVNPANSSILR